MSLSYSARPLDPWRWLAAPALLCLVLTILFAAPIRVFGLGLPQPVFPMVLAFAWALIRPSVLAPFILLASGLLLDIYWGGPLGLWALSLLAPYALLISSRTVMSGQGAGMRMVWYLTATGLAMAGGYLITLFRADSPPDPFAVFWQFLATAALYPFAHLLIDRFEDADVRFR